jgi:hypothetical protein
MTAQDVERAAAGRGVRMATRQEMFFQMVQEPTAENYRRLWEVITTAPEYSPYSDPYEAIEKLLETGEHAKARELLRGALGDLMLSPRIHLLAAMAGDGAGDAQASEFERVFYFKCLEAILATGDGSLESPYLVTRTSDEYDVLFHLKKELASQSLAEAGGKSLDVMTCTDGTDVCFDITRALRSIDPGN